jgi:uncharacterized damage-inducible protein DinB
MQSIDLLRLNLGNSTTRTLARIEDMRDHCIVAPTARGGGHTLWVLGHLAYVEALVIRRFMLGEENPLAAWEPIFDGEEPHADRDGYPPFDEVLATCRDMRAWTVRHVESLTEDDLDVASVKVPQGWGSTFGTVRLCVQYVADHWLMHRGQLADARRAAGVDRMWV